MTGCVSISVSNEGNIATNKRVMVLSNLTTKKLTEKKAAFSSKYRSRALSRKMFELIFMLTQNISPESDLHISGCDDGRFLSHD